MLIVNARSGTALKYPELIEQLQAHANASGGAYKLHRLSAGDNPATIARAALDAGATRIGAAGGDGTLSSVADVLAGTNIAFVPVRLGTMNHFATDLSLPDTPTDCARAMCDDTDIVEQMVDMGVVNGRHFLNNITLGMYPYLVRRRERLRHWGRWIGYAYALSLLFRHRITAEVDLVMEDGTPRHFRTTMLYIANNTVDTGWPNPGSRASLSDGHLHVIVLDSPRRRDTLSASWDVLRGQPSEHPLISEHHLTSITVAARRGRTLRAAIEGESMRLKSPLEIGIVSAALRVRRVSPRAVDVGA